LHRGRRRPGGARRYRGRQGAAARFRRQQRAGLGSRPRLRRQGASLRRARGMKLDLLKEATAATASGRSAALATNLKIGLQSLVEGSDIKGDLVLDKTTIAALSAAMRDDRSTTVETAGGPVFIEVFNPPLRCFVVGAVHIAQPLAQM